MTLRNHRILRALPTAPNHANVQGKVDVSPSHIDELVKKKPAGTCAREGDTSHEKVQDKQERVDPMKEDVDVDDLAAVVDEDPEEHGNRQRQGHRQGVQCDGDADEARLGWRHLVAHVPLHVLEAHHCYHPLQDEAKGFDPARLHGQEYKVICSIAPAPGPEVPNRMCREDGGPKRPEGHR